MCSTEIISGMKMVKYRGHMWPTMELWPEGYDWAQWFQEADNNFEARADDIYIASFPKSGRKTIKHPDQMLFYHINLQFFFCCGGPNYMQFIFHISLGHSS